MLMASPSFPQTIVVDVVVAAAAVFGGLDNYVTFAVNDKLLVGRDSCAVLHSFFTFGWPRRAFDCAQSTLAKAPLLSALITCLCSIKHIFRPVSITRKTKRV